MTSKEGRVNSYKVEPLRSGERLRVNTSPDGTVSQTLIKTNGETVMTSADGTEIVSKQGPDPRFGMQAPVTEEMTITTPKGLSALVTTKKTATLLNANDPLSLRTLTTKITRNGRVSTSVYKTAYKKVTSTSAEGRQTVSYFDEFGRAINSAVPGLASVYYAYDERGRLTQVTSGEGDEARISTINYDPDSGYVAKITDTLNRTKEFTRDKVGRVLIQKLPDGRQIYYSYDANGNVTSITPPSKPVHEFDYTTADLQQQYIPPLLNTVSEPQTQYAYNLDKQLIQIQRPDGQTIGFVYDAVKKRLNRIELPNNESISYIYDDSTGQLMTLTAPNGSTLSYTYDGSLTLSETWGSGDITGTLSLGYNNDFRVTSASINDSHTVNYQYDGDGLLTYAGDLSLTRNGQNGLLEATQLGNIETLRTYNIFGEVVKETVSSGEQVRYNTSYQRDKLGRITKKTETIEDVTTTYDYRYDVTGRLKEVKQDDVVVEAYSYDDNGNRLTADLVSGTMIANYDNQDRLSQYGNASYTYTDNGELRRKDENGQVTEYQYDVLGNLQTVQLPNGNQIEYVIDGRNRRIGKKVNGVLIQAFLYQGSLNPIAELDGDGNVVSQFVYGSKANVPDYMVKGGKTYRILSNHLGSPKLVVNISDGSIVQMMDYDAFGNIVEDSNPGFQPFGFAGGIYDLDTKLTRFGARDYDARIGRWTAKDPILFAGGNTNLYGYVKNDPVNYIDVSGLLSKAECELLLQDINYENGVLQKLEKMRMNWTPGQGWADYGLRPDASVTGYRSDSFSSHSQTYQDVVNDMESDILLTITMIFANFMIGGVNIYSLGLHGLIHDTTLQEQQTQQLIATEKIRSMIVLSNMRKIYEEQCSGQCSE
jgi:RHS repeat-associated protein